MWFPESPHTMFKYFTGFLYATPKLYTVENFETRRMKQKVLTIEERVVFSKTIDTARKNT